MGYVLLWFEHLATALLVIAAITAWLAGVRRPLLRASALSIVLAILFVGHGALLAMAGYLHFSAGVAGTRFWPLLLLTLLFMSISLAMVIGGLRRRDAGPAAAAWPRGRLAIAAMVALLLYGMTLWNMDLSIRQQLSTLKVEAGAMALSVAPQRVSDRQNAALLYEAAARRMSKEPWPQPVHDLIADPALPLEPHLDQVKSLLAADSGALELLRRAVAMPDCYFEHPYGQPALDMVVPEIEQLRDAARLLALSARFHAATGDLRQALADVSGLFRVAEHCAGQPLIISVMVGANTHQTATALLEQILAANPREADLAALTIDEHLSFTRVFQRSLVMEEALGMSAFTMLNEHDIGWLAVLREEPAPPVRAGWSAAAFLYRVFLLPDDVAIYRSLMSRMRQLAARPWTESSRGMRDVDESFRPGQRRGILTSLLVPALSHALHRAFEAEAKHRLALAGRQVALAKAAGSPLDSADGVRDALGARLPHDPFNDLPLRLRVEGQRLVIYSIGPDGVDDGGKAYDKQTRTGDFVFTIPRSGK